MGKWRKKEERKKKKLENAGMRGKRKKDTC